MAHHAPSRGKGLRFSRLGGRGVALGAIAAVLATASVPAMTGCQSVPQIVHAVMTICPPLIEAVRNMPHDTLPAGYEPCGEEPWTVRGATIKLCFHCSRDATRPVYVQLGCSGKYFPVYPSTDDDRTPRKDHVLDTGVHLSSIDCEETLLAIAQGKADQYRRRLQASIVIPNERLLPSAAGYRSLTITLDGVEITPDGGDFATAHSAVGIEGTLDEVAHYAARAGIRSLEFRESGTAWAVEVCPDFPVAAVFKNAELVETMLLFSPDA